MSSQTSPRRSARRRSASSAFSSLGINQTDASVTLRGPFAGHGCRRLLDQTSILPVRFVEISQRGDAPVVCSFTHRYVKVTVRDPGGLQLLGDNTCTVVRDIVTHVAAGHRLADTTGDTAIVVSPDRRQLQPDFDTN